MFKKNYSKLLEKHFENTKDVKKKLFEYAGEELYIFFQEELANIDNFEKYYLINIAGQKSLIDFYPGICFVIEEKDLKELCESVNRFLFYGNIILIKDNVIYRFNLQKPMSRGISDSISEAPNIMGSRDGFTDSCSYNTALLRTRIRSNCLGMEEYSIGRRSQTKVNLFYITDITNVNLVERIDRTLKKIDIDAVLTTSDITSYFNKSRLFQTFTYSGSPDVIASNLLDGQVVIMIDRIPVCVVMPISLFLCSRIRLDLEAPTYYVFISRLVVLICFFVSVFFLGLMACFLTLQQNNLSLIVLTTIKLTQKGALFPMSVEILLTIFLFEFYQLIGLRSASFSVQTIIVIIAGILIGQATIAGGLVSVLIMLLTAFTFLCTFIISSDIKIVMSLSIMRIIILVSSLTLGLFGFSVASILLFSYIYRKRFLNICFLHPLVPFDFKAFKKFFTTRSYYRSIDRDENLQVTDKTRRGKVNEKKK